FSRRGLLRAYGPPPFDGFDVRDLVARAAGGEAHARETLAHAVRVLGAVLTPCLVAFAPTAVVVGGSMARGWSLLGPLLVDALAGVPSLRDVAPTALGDTAP